MSILDEILLLLLVPLFSTTIMIILIISTISVAVAVTINLTNFIVLTHITMSSTIVGIIFTCIINCTINVTIETASNHPNTSIPAPVLLLSLLLLVRLPSNVP